MPGPTFTIPDPPSGYMGIPASDQDDQEANFFGDDIYFDVTNPDPSSGCASYVVTADGDWARATGVTALEQSMLRRLITNPGDYKTKPNYGCGARSYVKARNTEANRTELASRIKAQFAQDDRVQSVDVVTVVGLADGTPGLRVQVTITPVGRLRANRQVTFSWEVR